MMSALRYALTSMILAGVAGGAAAGCGGADASISADDAGPMADATNPGADANSLTDGGSEGGANTDAAFDAALDAALDANPDETEDGGDAGACFRIEARLVAADGTTKVDPVHVGDGVRIAAVLHNECVFAATTKYQGFTYSSKLPGQASATQGSTNPPFALTFTVPPGGEQIGSADANVRTPTMTGSGLASIRLLLPPKLQNALNYTVVP